MGIPSVPWKGKQDRSGQNLTTEGTVRIIWGRACMCQILKGEVKVSAQGQAGPRP